MQTRLLGYGFGLWIVGTAVLRLWGQKILDPNRPLNTVLLFLISFPLMALLTRRLCAPLPRSQWPAGAISVAVPTLLLDPFSCAFFPAVFPNIAPEMAGIFGGWLLWCCAGALTIVMIPERHRS